MSTNAQLRNRKILADALIELVNEKPFEKVTVLDLCQTAHLNHSTFYRQYHNKYELLRAILPDLVKSVYTGNWVNQEEMLRSLLAWTDENRVIVRNLLADIDSMTTYRELVRVLAQQMLIDSCQDIAKQSASEVLQDMHFPEIATENMATLMMQFILQWADHPEFTEAQREAYIADALRLMQVQ